VGFYTLAITGHVQPEALQALLEREIGPEAKDAIMTAGQRLIEQGRQQGHHEGFQQGECAVLLRLLRPRFGGQVDTQVERRLAAASVDQLEAWTGRVLTVSRLAELLAD